MKCQILFSRKNKKYIPVSAEIFTQHAKCWKVSRVGIFQASTSRFKASTSKCVTLHAG